MEKEDIMPDPSEREVSSSTVSVDAEHNRILLKLQEELPGRPSKKSLVENAIEIASSEWLEQES